MSRIRLAGILPIDNGFAFMHRVGVKNHPIGDYYTFPGGGREGEESFEEGVKREIKEEFGINVEVSELLYEKHGIKHSVEYISSLWRNKIPKLIVEEAENEYLIWHYTFEEKGHWKRCSRCGQIKLGHNHFFSKNKTSKDGWYSICKECRNSASKKK